MLFLLAAMAPADPLLSSLAAAPDVEELTCPFQVLVRSEDNGNENRVLLEVDPVSGETTVLERSERLEPDDDAQAEAEDEDDDDDNSVSIDTLDYAAALSNLDLPFERVSEDNGVVVFRASKLPKGTVDVGGVDVSKNSALTLSVLDRPEGPLLERYHVALVKPKRIKLVAKLREFERAVTFGELNGQPRPFTEEIKATFSALGNQGNFGVSMNYDYQPCDAPAEADVTR